MPYKPSGCTAGAGGGECACVADDIVGDAAASPASLSRRAAGLSDSFSATSNSQARTRACILFVDLMFMHFCSHKHFHFVLHFCQRHAINCMKNVWVTILLSDACYKMYEKNVCVTIRLSDACYRLYFFVL